LWTQGRCFIVVKLITAGAGFQFKVTGSRLPPTTFSWVAGGAGGKRLNRKVAKDAKFLPESGSRPEKNGRHTIRPKRPFLLGPTFEQTTEFLGIFSFFHLL
jgi:hypothetical protein